MENKKEVLEYNNKIIQDEDFRVTETYYFLRFDVTYKVYRLFRKYKFDYCGDRVIPLKELSATAIQMRYYQHDCTDDERGILFLELYSRYMKAKKELL